MEIKINQRVMLTKRLLKNTLIEILQTKSIYKISIRELCERAGINRSTFYKYYGSQFDLLTEMEQDMLQDIEESLSKNNTPNPKVLCSVLEYMEDNLELVRLLFNSNADSEFPQKLFSLPIIHAMIKELFPPEISLQEYEYLSSFLIYGAYQIVHIWINKENRESADYLAELITKQIIR